MPGRIDELASAILNGDLTISDERRWLPRMHRALVVLVLIAAGMGWLIFNGYPKGSSSEVEPVARPSGETGDRGERKRHTCNRVACDEYAGRFERRRRARAGRSITGQTAKAEAEPVAVEQTKRVTQETCVAGAAANIAGRRNRSGASPATGRSRDARSPPMRNRPRRSRSRRPNKPNRPARAAAKPVQTEAATPPSSVVGKARSAQWLRQQPAKNFTLQLFATTSRARRDEFIRQQDQAGALCDVRDETRRHTLVCGDVRQLRDARRSDGRGGVVAAERGSRRTVDSDVCVGAGDHRIDATPAAAGRRPSGQQRRAHQ